MPPHIAGITHVHKITATNSDFNSTMLCMLLLLIIAVVLQKKLNITLSKTACKIQKRIVPLASTCCNTELG